VGERGGVCCGRGCGCGCDVVNVSITLCLDSVKKEKGVRGFLICQLASSVKQVSTVH